MSPEIPEAERKVIKEWLVEGDDRLGSVLGALEAATPTLLRQSLIDQVVQKTQLDSKVLGEVLPVFFSLVSTVTNADDEADAIRTIFNTVVNQLADVEKLKAFEERVRRLVGLRSIEITSKALRVMFDNPNTFCRARTLSELRPIFSKEGLRAETGVIVHQLKLVFHTGPKKVEREVFLTLDRNDLDEIKKLMERTIAKHNELERISSDKIMILKPVPPS
jgi:hypothetical protein